MQVHYMPQGYTGGILEFMSSSFLRDYHRSVYEAGAPHGNLDAVDWQRFPQVQLVDCIPLSHVFAKAKVRHVNFFILDVEVRRCCAHAPQQSYTTHSLTCSIIRLLLLLQLLLLSLFPLLVPLCHCCYCCYCCHC